MTTLALPEPPDPPAGAATPPARRRLLAQCLVLAGLLHLLLVLALGNTPGGSARPGEGLWGAFQVRLVGTGPAGPPEAAVLDAAHTGAPGQAERQRFGGAVRPAAEARPDDGPGAARPGRWLPQAAEGDALTPPLALQADPAAPAALSMAVPPTAVQPLAAAELPAHQSVDLARPLPAEPAPAAPLPPPPLPAFELQPAPAPRVMAARPPQRSVAPAAALDLPALAPPALPSFAVQAQPSDRQVMPRPVAGTVAPLAGTDLPAAPAPQPALPSFPVQAAPPPRPLAQRERPSTVGALAAAELAAAPADAPPLPSFAAQPVAAPRAVAAPAQPPAVATAAAADLSPSPAASPALPSFAAAPPAALVPASPLGVRQVAGAPDAGARVGHDLATAPSQPASAARLNLDLLRPRGGLIAPQGSRGLLSVLPHPPELKTKLEKEIDLAGLADCRKAYSAMGLAALAPLTADALREKGCRW